MLLRAALKESARVREPSDRPRHSVARRRRRAVRSGLRPRRLDDYIGQDRVRENLDVSIAAARQRGEALDHVLLYGPPGLGKTTLAYVIANELGVAMRTTAGPVIEKPGDLAGILSNLQAREVLFIDEIHRLAPAIEEILYPAMEDFELDIVIGQGPGARSVKVPIERFTLVGATTRAGLLDRRPCARASASSTGSTSTRQSDIEEIVRRSARILGVDGRATPQRRLRGARAARRASPTACCAACAITRRSRPMDGSRARSRAAAMELLEVDEHGFDEVDRRLLMTIIEKFGGGPVGLKSLAAATSEEPDAHRGHSRAVSHSARISRAHTSAAAWRRRAPTNSSAGPCREGDCFES